MQKIAAIAVLLASLAFLPSEARAGAEWVHVAETMSDDDTAILVRHNGEAYLVEKGTGCLSLWRKEGRQILVNSPGIFLGVGSELILPDEGQSCRVWNAEHMGQWAKPPAQPVVSGHQNPVVILQLGLTALGYDPGPAEGLIGPKTITALRAFQEAEGLRTTGELNEATVQALVSKLAAAGVSLPQPGRATGRSRCESGHWVDEVVSSGEYVQLEDGSLWEIDPLNHIDTMLWLPTENITVCGSELINTDTGERVSARQLR